LLRATDPGPTISPNPNTRDVVGSAPHDEPVASVNLRLRPVRPTEEACVLSAHELLSIEGFNFVTGFHDEMSWPEFVASLDEQRRSGGLPPPWVPATTP